MLKKCTAALAQALRSSSCSTANTVAELATCQIEQHDAATDAILTLVQ
jgi:hypothetical protein